jgi:hypothetical protein
LGVRRLSRSGRRKQTLHCTTQIFAVRTQMGMVAVWELDGTFGCCLYYLVLEGCNINTLSERSISSSADVVSATWCWNISSCWKGAILIRSVKDLSVPLLMSCYLVLEVSNIIRLSEASVSSCSSTDAVGPSQCIHPGLFVGGFFHLLCAQYSLGLLYTIIYIAHNFAPYWIGLLS